MNKTIKIKRDPLFFRGQSLLSVYINEEKVSKLSSGEEKKLSFHTEHASLRVSLFGERSNTLEVSANDHIRVTIASWAIWVYLFKLLVLPVSLVYFELFPPFTSLLLLLGTFSLCHLFLKPFKLFKESEN